MVGLGMDRARRRTRIRPGRLSGPSWRWGRPHLTGRTLRVHPLVWVCAGAPDVPSAEAYQRILDGRRAVVPTGSQARLLLRALGCPSAEVEVALRDAEWEPARYGLPDDDRLIDEADEVALAVELRRSVST